MTVRNLARLKRRLAAIPSEGRAAIGQALAVSVVELDAYAKEKIQGGGRSGRIYRRRGVSHQASAPGEFPKTDRGQLVASLFFRVAADKLSAWFGTMLAYAKYLELKASQKGGRPWLRPTWNAKRDGIRARINRAIREATRKAASHG